MNRHRQSGSALLVALIVLLVVTVIGLSLASASRLDLLMIGAYQARAQTAEYAQAAIEMGLAAGTPPLDGAPHDASYEDAQLGITATVTSRYVTVTEPPKGGVSLGEGYVAFHFTARAEAEDPRGASVTLEQGYYVLGPGK